MKYKELSKAVFGKVLGCEQMKQWMRWLFGICMLGMIGTAGCGYENAEIRSGAPDFERNRVEAGTFSSEVEKYAKELSGNADYYCIPNESLTRKNSSDPVVMLYRVNDPKVLSEADVTVRLYPASVTKLLTAYTALKHANLDDTVTFSYQASHLNISGAMVCGFQEGDSLSLRDLLSAMLLFSGNDAAIAVAEHVSGSITEFAALMNQEMQKLGGMHSHFVNPHGLHDANHYTTAYDIYLVMNEMLCDDVFRSLVKQSTCTVYYTDAGGVQKTKTFQNTNRFLINEEEIPENVDIIGGKTGTTNAAGCCLVQAFLTKEGNTYIAEVFGAKDYDSLYEKMSELILIALESE